MSVEKNLILDHAVVQASINEVRENKARLLVTIRTARLHGWTYKDIAETLGISISRVQQLVRQANGLYRSNR